MEGGGKAIGGPKLAPVVSPGKTRSGAVSGVIGGIVAALIFSVIPVMKLLEDSFSYANQLGARQGLRCVIHPGIAAGQVRMERGEDGRPRVAITDPAYRDVLRDWLRIALA